MRRSRRGASGEQWRSEWRYRSARPRRKSASIATGLLASVDRNAVLTTYFAGNEAASLRRRVYHVLAVTNSLVFV